MTNGGRAGRRHSLGSDATPGFPLSHDKEKKISSGTAVGSVVVFFS